MEDIEDQFDILWLDSGKEPTCDPDKDYPYGIDVKFDNPQAQPTCVVKVPYPAKRIGAYVVTCKKCKGQYACTTAGRYDDPRSMEIVCQQKEKTKQ